MSLHLLVEQAIFDSSSYEVLSYEEVEALKKEHETLTKRIDAATNKLAMESKVRDAALSLSRLTSKKSRRSAASTASDTKGDEEYAASSRKCDELSAELAKLNARANEVQRRLLQHSAGILGVAHKAVGDGGASRGSVEYSLSSSNPIDPQAFDDRSFYKTVDKLAGFGEMSRGVGGDGAQKAVEDELVVERLEMFNAQVQELLRSAGAKDLPLPDKNLANTVHEQLTLLEQNLHCLRENPPSSDLNNRAAEQLEHQESILTTLWDMIVTFDEEVREQKLERKQNGELNADYPESDDEPEAPEFSMSVFSSRVQRLLNKVMKLRGDRDMLRERTSHQERGMEEDMKMMQDEISTMGAQVEQLSTLLGQRENELTAANAKMQNLTAELNQRNEELQHTANELEESRTAFSMKSAEFLEAMHELDVERSKDKQRANEANAGLQQEHSALQQANQALAELQAQLIEKENRLAEMENQAREMKEHHNTVRADLEAAVAEKAGKLRDLEQDIIVLHEAVETSEKARNWATEQENLLRQQSEENDAQMKKMDAELEELRMKVAELSTEVVMAKAELDIAYGSKSERAAATAQAKAAALALEKANKQPQSIDPGLLSEIANLEKKNNELIDEIVMLKTERAEGANSEHLEKRCKMLQKELDDMLKDFENLTKQSIEAEQERTKLESTIDALKEKLEELETTMAEEKIRLLAVGPPRPSVDVRSPLGRTGESTTTSVLKTEFKKMMRHMRQEQAKALNAERDERRKLEQMIRNMKKEQLMRRMTPPVNANANVA
ncbi:Up-regulated during septation-domain-containing protein [Sphaerosporella brunnea]|uniref:Up-regulated during septation-domain-containing protein n=1 Tax=Sphaerosporella brunnea TaxID=1250544 RepID=A0A5J5F335_9PEZI|nr:Up-regulated during septation-domain-containing protein [Sphaerosporella brunnea]